VGETVIDGDVGMLVVGEDVGTMLATSVTAEEVTCLGDLVGGEVMADDMRSKISLVAVFAIVGKYGMVFVGLMVEGDCDVGVAVVVLAEAGMVVSMKMAEEGSNTASSSSPVVERTGAFVSSTAVAVGKKVGYFAGAAVIVSPGIIS